MLSSDQVEDLSEAIEAWEEPRNLPAGGIGGIIESLRMGGKKSWITLSALMDRAEHLKEVSKDLNVSFADLEEWFEKVRAKSRAHYENERAVHPRHRKKK